MEAEAKMQENHYHRQIRRLNRQKPVRYPCPTCKRENAISEWEKQKGYHCAGCTQAAEGPC